jgi:hypothetical protein
MGNMYIRSIRSISAVHFNDTIEQCTCMHMFINVEHAITPAYCRERKKNLFMGNALSSIFINNCMNSCKKV